MRRWRRSHRFAARSPSCRRLTSYNSARSASMERRSSSLTSRRRSHRISNLAWSKQTAEPLPEPGVLGPVCFEGSQPLFGQLEIPPRASAFGLVESRDDEALAFEAPERDEHRRLCNRPVHPLLERQHERHAVGLPLLPQHGQKHVELEVLKGGGRHEAAAVYH